MRRRIASQVRREVPKHAAAGRAYNKAFSLNDNMPQSYNSNSGSVDRGPRHGLPAAQPMPQPLSQMQRIQAQAPPQHGGPQLGAQLVGAQLAATGVSAGPPAHTGMDGMPGAPSVPGGAGAGAGAGAGVGGIGLPGGMPTAYSRAQAEHKSRSELVAKRKEVFSHQCCQLTASQSHDSAVVQEERVNAERAQAQWMEQQRAVNRQKAEAASEQAQAARSDRLDALASNGGEEDILGALEAIGAAAQGGGGGGGDGGSRGAPSPNSRRDPNDPSGEGRGVRATL